LQLCRCKWTLVNAKRCCICNPPNRTFSNKIQKGLFNRKLVIIGRTPNLIASYNNCIKMAANLFCPVPTNKLMNILMNKTVSRYSYDFIRSLPDWDIFFQYISGLLFLSAL